jgi:hypothetical protein
MSSGGQFFVSPDIHVAWSVSVLASAPPPVGRGSRREVDADPRARRPFRSCRSQPHPPVRRPDSNRNGGRFQIGSVAGIKSENVAAFSWNLQFGSGGHESLQEKDRHPDEDDHNYGDRVFDEAGEPDPGLTMPFQFGIDRRHTFLFG